MPRKLCGCPAFVTVGELKSGDILSLADGSMAEVTGRTVEYAPAGQAFTTFNFEVKDFHTYFVGTYGVWVHNEGEFCEILFTFFNQFLNRFSGNLWSTYRHVLTGPAPWFKSLPSRWKLRLFNDVRHKHFASPGTAIPDWRNLAGQTLTPIPPGATKPVGWTNSDMAKEMEKNVKAALGIDRPDFPAALHHLIAHTDNDAATQSGANLRALLQSKGIHPNEACNSCYLPRSEAVADLNPLYGPRHQSLHTDAFLQKMWLRLQGHASSSPDVLRDALMKMGADIVDGTFTP